MTITDDQINGELEISLEPLISGMDLASIDNTDDAPEAAQYDVLRALSPNELEKQFNEAWPEIKSKFQITAGSNVLDVIIGEVNIPEIGNIELTRASKLQISAALPDDGSDITFGWNAELGEIIIRQLKADGEVNYATLLTSGGTSDPMPRIGGVSESGVDNFLNYIVIGFE
ncbi:MAG: hypothetical protein ABJ024_15675, partial [Lentilitoribacter sp.]